MTTEHEETEKLRPCPWCGQQLQLAGRFSFICENGYCLISNHALSEGTWQNAYCWKLLDEKNETIRSQDEKIKELDHCRDNQMKRIWEVENAACEYRDAKEKELAISRSAVRRLREALQGMFYLLDSHEPIIRQMYLKDGREALQETSDTKEVG